MRRKGRKVIKPAGSELMDYLNKGYAICNKCGAVMDRKEDPEGGCGIYACPSTGRALAHRNDSANHVGAENEAFAKATLGNGLRPP